MSRFNDKHKQTSLDIARTFLTDSGYSKEDIAIVVDDAIEFRSCSNGDKPQTIVGQILTTADAMAHLVTNFYEYTTENLTDDRPLEVRQTWA